MNNYVIADEFSQIPEISREYIQMIVVDINSRPNPLTCVISKKVKKGATCSASMITKKKIRCVQGQRPNKVTKTETGFKIKKN